MTALFRLFALLLPSRVRARHLPALVRTFETSVATARRSGGTTAPLVAAWREYIDVCRSAMRARFGGDPLESGVPQAPGRRLRRLSESLASDARFGFRLLVRQPVFSLAAILTLALGIGANVAVFSVVWHVLLAPSPYRAEHEVVSAFMTTARSDRGRFSPLDLRDLGDRSRTLAGVAWIQSSTRNLTGAGDPQRLPGFAVTGNFFDVLGVAPEAGRWFTPDEVAAGARVVVVSHELWQGTFGGSVDAIGREISLNNEPATVIGVMPEGGTYPDGATFWAPMQLEADDFDPPQRGARYLQAVARLAPGVDLEAARTEVGAIGTALAAEFPNTNRESSMTVENLRAAQVAGIRPSLIALGAGVLLVLVIACGNLANLLLTRGLARAGEMAVRASLGASRTRIVTQLLVEGVVLATAGGIVAVLFAVWGVRSILLLAPEGLPRLQYVEINMPVLLFLAALTGLTALVFGLVPAWHVSRADLAQLTRDSGTRSATRGRGLRRVLAVGEVALAVTLVGTAGLLARTIVELARIDPGFDTARVLTFTVTLPDPPYDTPERREATLTGIAERLRALPGVHAAAFGYGVPYGPYNAYTSFAIDGIETPPGTDFLANLRMVGPGYFETLGIPLRAGRAPAASDRIDAPLVAVISEEAARRYFGGEDPVGKRINVHVRMASGAPRGDITVVGIAGDVRARSLTDEIPPEIYQPYPQHAMASTTFTVRTAGDPMAVTGQARAILRDADPDLAMAQVRTMEDMVGSSIARERLAATLLSVFAVIAVVLAAIGLYGVFSVGVAQRTREIGIRMALGADRRRVLSMFVREGVALALAGAALGLGGALAAATLVESLLVGVSPRDPATLTAATLALLVVAAAASYLPARRASRTNAAEVLQR